MKLKLNLDKAAIKSFFVSHGEKLAFALAALCFVFFAWSAFNRETLPSDKQPAKLGEAAERAKNHVANSQWDPKRENLALADYPGRAKRTEVPIEDFALSRTWDPELIPQKTKRSAPELFPAEELRVAANVGTFAMSVDPPAGKGGKGAVKGGKGFDKGDGKARPEPKKGKGARNDNVEDIVDMLAPRGAARLERPADKDIEFAGINPPAASKLQPTYWVVVTALLPNKKQTAAYDRVFEQADGGDKERDVPNYNRPFVQRALDTGQAEDQLKWEPLPNSKAFRDKWAVDVPELVDPDYIWYAMPLGPLVGAWWDETVGHYPQIPFLKELPHMKLAKEDEDEPDAKPADEEVAEEEEFGDAKKKKGPDREALKKQERNNVGRPGQKKRFVEYLMVRFFDFSVEPGKKYRYRIKMQLDNPNYEVLVRYLKTAELAKQEFIQTNWSAATPPVTIPYAERVLAGGVTIKSGEPFAKFVASTIDPGLGFLAATEFTDVTRGTLIDAVKNVDVLDPRSRQWTKAEVPFHMQSIALDIRGGRPLPGKDKLVEPSEVVLFDREGNLVIRDESEDAGPIEDIPGDVGGEADKPKRVRQQKLPGAMVADAGKQKAPTRTKRPRSTTRRTTPKAKSSKAMKASRGGDFE